MQDFLTSPFVPLLAMFAVAYFLLLRPQQARAKALRDAIANVRRGDTVITAGGIVAKVVKAPANDDPELTVEIADNVQVRVLKTTLSDVRAKSQPVESAK
ncbi:MAG: preprotein translocase subunit YajC [Alphaproteobacteria bacterium]|nr:preprotein translocase subunit YajC [Alphaproteobacteria bacterium]MBV9694275.1 preprotein translocase subunit YajC [Alphaproteobacteria bacterium]